MSENPPAKLRLSQVVEGLSGLDVINIEDHFGRSFDELSGTRLIVGLMAVLKRREGMNAKDAWQAAKAMSLRELNDSFEPEPDLEVELDTGDPAGKG